MSASSGWRRAAPGLAGMAVCFVLAACSSTAAAADGNAPDGFLVTPTPDGDVTSWCLSNGVRYFTRDPNSSRGFTSVVNVRDLGAGSPFACGGAL